MKIVTITEESKKPFEDLISASEFEKVPQNEYALGAVVQEGTQEYAAGILTFDVEEGMTDGGNLIAVTIKWFFVAEKFRRKGVGEALMQEFFRVVDEADMDDIFCDIQMPQEYNELCAYLESWGFTFTLMDSHVVSITLGMVREKCAFVEKIATQRVRPLKEIEEKDFNDFCIQARQGELELTDLDSNIAIYEQKISCYIEENGKIDSVLLVHKDALNALEVKLLKSIAEIPTDIAELMAYGVREALKSYPDDTIVSYLCRTQAGCNLTARLFPEIQPPLVRRGYWSRELTGLQEE